MSNKHGRVTASRILCLLLNLKKTFYYFLQWISNLFTVFLAMFLLAVSFSHKNYIYFLYNFRK
jgi:hypothetical protein